MRIFLGLCQIAPAGSAFGRRIPHLRLSNDCVGLRQSVHVLIGIVIEIGIDPDPDPDLDSAVVLTRIIDRIW